MKSLEQTSMKILLFGGFLGSGKTSTILHVAKYILENQKGTVAIIENEIGEVGVDDKMLAAQGFTVRGVFAGCVCCQITGELLGAVTEIHATIKPDWLIIETTGLAKPGNIVDLFTKYCHCYEFLKTIVTVDAERWEELYDVLKPLMVAQVEAADVVLVNKADLIIERTSEQVANDINKLNTKAGIFLTSASNGVCAKTLQEMIKV